MSGSSSITSGSSAEPFSIPSTGLSAALRAHAPACDLKRLLAAEQAVDAAISEHFGAGHPHTDQQLARVSSAMWEVVRAWARARGEAECGVAAREIGCWKLAPIESAWINGGLVDTRFVADAGVSQTLVSDLYHLFAHDQEEIEVLSLADAVLAHYRETLGVTEVIEQQTLAAEFSRATAAIHSEIAKAIAAQHEALAEWEIAATTRALQQQLDRLLPHIARLTRLARKGGFGAEDRRTEMKVRETAQRLRVKVHEQIGHYERRKQYEKVEGETLELLMQAQELEERELARRGSQRLSEEDFSPQKRLGALADAVESVRTKVRIVTRSGSGEDPTFLLRHRPRLTPAAIKEGWYAIFEACPRLRAANFERWYPRVRVYVLPGQGNAIFDAQSGSVLATLFPLEARMQSLTAAIGECYLHLDAELQREYRRFMIDQPLPDASFREAFRRNFVAWVAKERAGGGNALDPEHERWFRQHLVVRRTRPNE